MMTRAQMRKAMNVESNYKPQRGQAKVAKVMHEFKEGELHSGSGAKVSSRDQAIAIAMSEAGMSRKRKSKR